MTSSNQDIKTNVAALAGRRGVRGSCFILRCVFVDACLGKVYAVAVLSRLDDITGRPLIQIMAGLPFGNLSNDRHVFDKFTQAISSQE